MKINNKIQAVDFFDAFPFL